MLTAVVLHQGFLDTGHFTSMLRNCTGGWTLYDDEKSGRDVPNPETTQAAQAAMLSVRQLRLERAEPKASKAAMHPGSNTRSSKLKRKRKNGAANKRGKKRKRRSTQPKLNFVAAGAEQLAAEVASLRNSQLGVKVTMLIYQRCQMFESDTLPLSEADRKLAHSITSMETLQLSLPVPEGATLGYFHTTEEEVTKFLTSHPLKTLGEQGTGIPKTVVMFRLLLTVLEMQDATALILRPCGNTTMAKGQHDQEKRRGAATRAMQADYERQKDIMKMRAITADKKDIRLVLTVKRWTEWHYSVVAFEVGDKLRYGVYDSCGNDVVAAEEKQSFAEGLGATICDFLGQPLEVQTVDVEDGGTQRQEQNSNDCAVFAVAAVERIVELGRLPKKMEVRLRGQEDRRLVWALQLFYACAPRNLW
jgi:hypothetical protein